MGLFYSKTTDQILQETQRERERERERIQGARRYALHQRGILIPPLFGITPTTTTRSASVHDMDTIQHPCNYSSTILRNSSVPLGYVDYLQSMDRSTCLLNHHFQSGLWIMTHVTAPTTATAVRVGILDTNSTESVPSQQQQYNITPTNSNNNNSVAEATTATHPYDDDDESTASAYGTLVNGGYNSHSTYGGQFGLERKFIHPRTGNTQGMVQFHTGTNPNSCPVSFVSGKWFPTNSLSLFATIAASSYHHRSSSSNTSYNNNDMTAYIGGHWDPTIRWSTTTTASSSVKEKDNDDHSGNNDLNHTIYCKVGAWVPLKFNKNIWSNWNHVVSSSPNITAASSTQQERYKSALSSPEEIHGYAAISFLGATAALQATLPLGSGTSSPVTSSYFTTNLTDDQEQPPLQITIQQHNKFGRTMIDSVSSISVCQVLTFDRYQFNPYEDRAPFIRNTLAWTIQMESLPSAWSNARNNDVWTETDTQQFKKTGSLLAEDSGEHTPRPSLYRMNQMSLGAVWQINRVLAIKAIVYPQNQQHSPAYHHHHHLTTNNSTTVGATTAILLKRWQYPRITCSILHKWGGNDPNHNHTATWSSLLMPRFAGIGIEIETGDDGKQEPSYNTTNPPNGSTPPTADHDVHHDADHQRRVPPTIVVLPNGKRN
jgi:hypothetical protein